MSPVQAINSNEEITHIISLIKTSRGVSKFIEDHGVTQITHLMEDSEQTDLIHHWMELKMIIGRILYNENGNILIHCMAGRSRSMAIGLLVLMEFYGLSFEKAYRYIDRKRQIGLNRGFEKALKDRECI